MAEHYYITGWKKCVLINNLSDGGKARLFRNLFQKTFGFDVRERSNLSTDQMETTIRSIPENFVPVPNGVFILVILTERGDPTVVCGNDNNALFVRDIMAWINNASMPAFYGIPRIVIYFSEEDFNPLHYNFNGGNAEVADLLAVCINYASFGDLTDCEAVCEALRQYSPQREFSEILRRLNCSFSNTGFKKLRLTQI